jgi:hypothetical protein
VFQPLLSLNDPATDSVAPGKEAGGGQRAFLQSGRVEQTRSRKVRHPFSIDICSRHSVLDFAPAYLKYNFPGDQQTCYDAVLSARANASWKAEKSKAVLNS